MGYSRRAGISGFLLVGVVIFLPLVLFYTAFSFWVFRGKVRRHAGYE